ncbi:MAG: XdhC family protein [Flavobacteriaceae bacterium]
MIHELKKIIQAFEAATKAGLKSVMATVVALEGSSYRRPGVRMLIISDGKMIGAVSGGCVEKEILRQAQDVFSTQMPKMMTYDGRYRLGCEGILYILIEPFEPNIQFTESFWSAVAMRKPIVGHSIYTSDSGSSAEMGSLFQWDEEMMAVRPEFSPSDHLEIFKQQMEPCHKLIIIGAEHDAVQLCSYAALTGWEVSVVASPAEEKVITDFPGAKDFHAIEAEELNTSEIDDQTSVLLMTHSYVKDLAYLIKLKDTSPLYLGLLGPAARREKLLNEFLERCPEVDQEFVDNIHGPAGLHLGAETPQEIAISIISEILSVHRQTQPKSLKDKSGAIHNQ